MLATNSKPKADDIFFLNFRSALAERSGRERRATNEWRLPQNPECLQSGNSRCKILRIDSTSLWKVLQFRGKWIEIGGLGFTLALTQPATRWSYLAPTGKLIRYLSLFSYELCVLAVFLGVWCFAGMLVRETNDARSYVVVWFCELVDGILCWETVDFKLYISRSCC